MTREMKDSGIEWIGRIPCNWKLNKISSLYKLRNQKVSDKDYQPLSVSMKGIVPQLETAAKTNAHDDRKLVRKGDFAINSRSDRRGSCGISPYNGSVSLINTVLCPRENMDPGYYNWLFHTTQFSDEFYKCGHGIVDDLWTTGWQDMKKICIPNPKINEQQKISNFLNLKCSQIDSIHTSLQDQIDTLEQYKKSVITEAVTKGLNPDVEMKDSGIEWIGEIPSHWDTIKIKHTSLLKGRIGWQGLRTDEYLEEVSLPYLITGTDFEGGEVNWGKCAHVSEDRYQIDKNIHIYENDLLITKDGTIGKLAIVNNCPDKACLNSGVFLIRNVGNYKYNKKFLYYILSSNQFIKWFNLSNSGNSTIKHLNQEKFYEFSYTYPNLKEQQQIVDYLDAKCFQIDSIISQKKEQMETLKEYKKSLIYEYVTGKKEVPNA